jgi:D-aminopeptidase
LRHLLFLICLLPVVAISDDSSPRARALGIPFDGTPGPLNAITDVAGVTVGHETIVQDLADNKAVRTGVTAVLPRGVISNDQPVFGAWFTLNGNGEMTGTTWLEESGFLEGPVMITNTHSVGTVHQATIQWRIDQGAADASGYWWSLPVVAETWDGYLNDINGFHVKAEHARAALDAAKSGLVPEGSVGGGTGMICHGFKCGIGTSSRIAETDEGSYTVGVLVQANYGSRDLLRIAGVPVGRHLQEDRPFAGIQNPQFAAGSIIIVVATNAPLLPHQLKRLLKRAALGLARNGSIASNGSGDIFIAFSTANKGADQASAGVMVRALANENINPMFLEKQSLTPS